MGINKKPIGEIKLNTEILDSSIPNAVQIRGTKCIWDEMN
jgi:hypothetical protein